MGKRKIPRVCFNAEPSSERDSGDYLSEKLEGYLSSRFQSVTKKKRSVPPVWNITLEANKRPFTLYFGKSRYKDDEWILMTAPLDVPILGFLRSSKSLNDGPELSFICHDIHAFLIATPGVADIRWYFEWNGVQSPAVHTPDQLSWD